VLRSFSPSRPFPIRGLGCCKVLLAQLSLLAAVFCAISGCSHQNAPFQSQTAASKAAERQARKTAQAKEEAAREQLEQILPPSKSLYLRNRNRDTYGNPFLLVHEDTVTLTIIYPDQNPTAFGNGSLLRPASARRQQLEVRLSDLAEALASLPSDVWPYGRVVAVEEAPSPPGRERVLIRRNVEATIQILNDLGVVVDEWTVPNNSLLR
jgi:hypothetical protein